MMDNRYVKTLACVAMLAASLAAAGYSDEEIKDKIVGSGQYIDNYILAREAFRHARECCEDDTNRFAQLLFEIAQTNDTRMAGRMINLLGTYGTSAQLPFLYSMVSNEQHGATAVKSILRLEGVTSNSVAVTGAYLSMTNVDFEYRADACKSLLRTAAQPIVPPIMRQLSINCALCYARTANRYVLDVDEVLIETDSTYRCSKRRLEILRTVHQLGVSVYQINYVTNAINELVAYPEAELPE